MSTSIMEPLRQRKRGGSAPCSARKALRMDNAMPDPWKCLAPLGEGAHRTGTALAELAAASQAYPGTWELQEAVAEAAMAVSGPSR